MEDKIISVLNNVRTNLSNELETKRKELVKPFDDFADRLSAVEVTPLKIRGLSIEEIDNNFVNISVEILEKLEMYKELSKFSFYPLTDEQKLDISNIMKELIKEINEIKKYTVQRILLTHGHFDHIWEADRLHEMLGVPVCAYETEAAFAADDKQNGSLLMMYESVTCKVHEAFKDGETFQIGEVPVTVLHTPGHTAGGVSYITPDAVFTGDTLMGYSVGRCLRHSGRSSDG